MLGKGYGVIGLTGKEISENTALQWRDYNQVNNEMVSTCVKKSKYSICLRHVN